MVHRMMDQQVLVLDVNDFGGAYVYMYGCVYLS
jgi:hypothetical protein